MEKFAVPLVMTVLSMLVGWLTWLTVKVFQNDKSIALNIQHDLNITTAIESMKKDIDNRILKLENQVNSHFERVFKLLSQKLK